MLSQRELEAAKVAQNLVKAHSQRNIVIDGYWGTTTQSAYNALSTETRNLVDQVLASFGTSASRLHVAFQAEKLANPKFKDQFVGERNRLLASASDMKTLVSAVARRHGVPEKTALTIAYLESKFDPNALSPTKAKGLFQFTTIAVRDVLERAGFDLRGREFDPEANATAGVLYIKLVARDMKVPLDDIPKIYMGFNIGPSAAKKYLAGDVTPQVAELINHQRYRPPVAYGDKLRAAVASASAMV